MSKFCGYCGAPLKVNSQFCTECGNPIKKNNAIVNGEKQSPFISYEDEINVVNPSTDTLFDTPNTFDSNHADTFGDSFETAQFDVGYRNAANNNGMESDGYGFERQGYYNDNKGYGFDTAPIRYEQEKSYEEPVKKKKSGSNAPLIVVLVVSLVVLLGILFYFFILPMLPMNNPLSSKQDFVNALSKCTEKQMIAAYFDDFDGNGSKELYAIVAENSGNDDSFKNADIWFISTEQKVIVEENFSGHTNGIITLDEEKFISVEKENEKSDNSISLIFGVQQDRCYRSNLSEKYSDVVQKKDIVVGFDPESKSYVSLNIGKDGKYEVTVLGPEKTKV